MPLQTAVRPKEIFKRISGRHDLYYHLGEPAIGMADQKNHMLINRFFKKLKFDELVKSPKTVMPDLIRHPEVVEITGLALVLHYVSGFRRNDQKGQFPTFYEFIKFRTPNSSNYRRILTSGPTCSIQAL